MSSDMLSGLWLGLMAAACFATVLLLIFGKEFFVNASMTEYYKGRLEQVDASNGYLRAELEILRKENYELKKRHGEVAKLLNGTDANCDDDFDDAMNEESE